jgi:hypothetical protein
VRQAPSFQRGLGMCRFFVFISAALCLLGASEAKALIVTNGETVQVFGDFAADPYAFVTATLIVNSNINFGNYPYPQFQTFLKAGASVGNFALASCGGNIPGPCEPAFSPPLTTTFIVGPVFSSPIIPVSTFFNAQSYNFSCFTGIQGCLPDPVLPDPAGTTSVDLELQNPELFSFGAPAVPEPSTELSPNFGDGRAGQAAAVMG